MWMDLETLILRQSDRERQIPYDVTHAFMHVRHFSCVWLFVTLWSIVHQAHLSMRFSGQEHWSGLPCCPPGDLPGPETKHTSLASPALWADSLPLSHLGSPISLTYGLNFLKKWYKLFAKYKQTHWFKDRLIVTKGEELIRSLWLACTHYCIQSGWPTRTSCIAQGTLLSVLW